MRLARWLVALPFLGILIGTAFVNQVEPLVFGMPFVLAWIVGWVVVGAAAMAIVYALDPAQRRPRGRSRRRAPMNAALVIIGLATLGALALGLAAHRGVRMTLEQWTVGRPRLRRAAGVPADRRRDLHHLHLPRRQRLGLRPRRADLLHPRLRLARLRHVLLAAAADLALRQARAPAVAAALLLPQIRQPMAGRARRRGRRRGAGALSGAAVPGPRHHRLDRLLRLDLADAGDLDRRGDGDDLRHDLRHARRGVERRRQGRAHPGGRRLPRRLPAAALLRRPRRNVPRHRRRQAGLPRRSSRPARAYCGSSRRCC